MKHCNIEIDDFIHGTCRISHSCTHMQSSWYNWAVQEAEKHFVHDLGARPQHGVDREHYEEGGGKNDLITNLQNSRNDENWLGGLVGGQPDDLCFGLSEDMEALHVGGRHLANRAIQCGLYEVDVEECELDDFGKQQLCCGLLVCLCPPNKSTFLRSELYSLFCLKKEHLCRFQF